MLFEIGFLVDVGRFWSILGAKMEPSWHQHRIKNRYQLRKAFFFFWKIALPSKQRFLIPFWCQLGSIWAPKIHKNPSKSKSQEASQKWSIFGSIFCPSWLHVGTQVGTQEPLQTVPKRLQDAPKTPRRQPKSHKSTQDRNLVHFWFQSPMGYPPLASIFKVCSPF